MPGPEIFLAMLVSRLGVRPTLLNRNSISASRPFLRPRRVKQYPNINKTRRGPTASRFRTTPICLRMAAMALRANPRRGKKLLAQVLRVVVA